LGHNIAIVTNDAAGSVPSLVDADAVDGANVQVGLAVDTTNWFVFSVARAVLVDCDFAGFRSDNLNDQDRIASGRTGVSICATIGSAYRRGTEMSAILKTVVNFNSGGLMGLLDRLAVSVVGDSLAGTLGTAFIFVSDVVSRTNG
jgi:hypothetical protein